MPPGASAARLTAVVEEQGGLPEALRLALAAVAPDGCVCVTGSLHAAFRAASVARSRADVWSSPPDGMHEATQPGRGG
jgi:hypothetical protein